MEPIFDVNTYIAIDQWGTLITGVSVILIFAFFLVRFVPVLI